MIASRPRSISSFQPLASCRRRGATTFPRPQEVGKGFAGPRVLHLIAGGGTVTVANDEVVNTGNPRRLEGYRTDSGGGGIQYLDDEPFTERAFVSVRIVQPGSGQSLANDNRERGMRHVREQEAAARQLQRAAGHHARVLLAGYLRLKDGSVGEHVTSAIANVSS